MVKESPAISSNQVETESLARVKEEHRAYLERLMGRSFWNGNSVKALHNGDEIFPAMLKAIRASRRSIELLTFIYWKGQVAEEFAEALASKAREGVSVRVLLDAWGSFEMDKSLQHKMEQGGVDLGWFRPLKSHFGKSDNRTHRKILVCDDEVGFTGGVGIASEWEGNARNADEWRDIHFEVKGPGVRGISGAFWDNWLEMRATDMPSVNRPSNFKEHGSAAVQIIPSSASDGGSNAAIILLGLIRLANKRLDLITPYLVLDEVFLEALKSRSENGVETRLLIPGRYIDKRFEKVEAERYLDKLLDAGVRVYRYQKTMLHTKVLLVDDCISCVGSMNLNCRSLRKDEESLMIIQDESMVHSLRKSMDNDIRQSRLIESVSQIRNSIVRRFFRWILKAFRKQL